MSSKNKKKDLRESAWARVEENLHVNPISETDVPSYYLTGIIPHSRSAEESDDPNFIPLSSTHGVPTLPKYDDTLRKKRQDASEFRYEIDPNYRGIIDSFLFFTIGTGFQIKANDEDPRVQEYIERFMAAAKFKGRDQDIVMKGLRSGELFIRFFKKDGNRVAKVPVMRILNYWEITKINRDPKDRETVTSYVRSFVTDDGSIGEEEIPANEIIHGKVAEKDQERATPPFDVISQACQWYRGWLHNRVVFNRLKTSFYLEEIIKGSPAKVTSADSQTPDQDRRGKRGGVIKRMPKPGSKLIHNDAVEYKWLKPEIGADDASEDGRAIRLSICAGAQVPEFMLGDAAKTNYASSLVAQNPFVRKVEFFRDHFEGVFQQIFEWVIKYGIEVGEIPRRSTKTEIVDAKENVGLLRKWVAKINGILNESKTSPLKIAETSPGTRFREEMDDDGNAVVKKVIETDRTVTIEWPNLIAQNLLQDSQAYQLHWAMGVASRETIAQRLGYDYPEELRRIGKDMQESPSNDEDVDAGGGMAGKQRDDEINAKDDDGDDE